jgi:hypothetical protein
MQTNPMTKRIQDIKGQLSRIGEMRPGSLNEQRTVCGRPNCHCADPKRPKKHGPYYQLSYVHQGKSTTQFVQKQWVGAVRLQLANYKRFKALTEEWVHIALALAKEKLRSDREGRRGKIRTLGQKQRAIRGTRSRETRK